MVASIVHIRPFGTKTKRDSIGQLIAIETYDHIGGQHREHMNEKRTKPNELLWACALSASALVLSGCAGGGSGLPAAEPLELTADDVADWTDEERTSRAAELELEIEQLNALRQLADEELKLVAPNSFTNATHLGSVTVTGLSCAETGGSGFSDILSVQPILRDSDGALLGSFTPLDRLDVGGECRVGFALFADDLELLSLYELDMGRRGEFVVTEAELEAGVTTSADGSAVYTWFELTIGR